MTQIKRFLSTCKRFLEYEKHKINRNIAIDITNVCNAKCYYCRTGFNNLKGTGAPKETFIEPKFFQELLRYLKAKQFLTQGSFLSLFSWYEPFLHPEFATIIDIASQEDCLVCLSTNANVLPRLPENFDASHIAVIYLSMCGFSQASYDKIHQFDFRHIKRNIEILVKTFRQHGFFGMFALRWHIYRFNIHEIQAAKDWAKSLGIIFKGYYAHIADPKRVSQYLHTELPQEELSKFSQELFMEYRMPYYTPIQSCPAFSDTYINMDGQCVLCCMNDTPMGSIFDLTPEKALQLHQESSVCAQCMQSGLANFIHVDINEDQSTDKAIHRDVRWYWNCLKTCFL